MKIAYITASPLPSGKANIVQSVEMARALCEAGAEVDFFCPRIETNESDAQIRDWLINYFNSELPFDLHLCKRITIKGRFGAMLTMPDLIRKAMKTNTYDYYYLRNSYLSYAMTLLGKPVIYEQHQWRYYEDELRSELVRQFSLRSSKRKACKLFVCISEELRKRWVNKGVPDSKTLTAHDAVDLEPFTPMLTREEARKALGLPENGTIVSYVGSLYGNRAIEDVLAAAKRYETVTFRFIGGPDQQKEKLEERVASQGATNVTFAGRVDRPMVPLQLFASDVLLFTMNEKTLTFDICSPMKIFEYMAAGRIIVAPDLPSMREVLRHPYAYLYAFSDAEDLAVKIGDAIATVQDEVAKSGGMEGRQVATKYYTWRQRAQSILEALQRG